MSFENIDLTPKVEDAEKQLASLEQMVQNIYNDIESGEISSKENFTEKYESEFNELLSKVNEDKADPLREEVEKMLNTL